MFFRVFNVYIKNTETDGMKTVKSKILLKKSFFIQI